MQSNEATIWQHHDELSLAKQAMLVSQYGWAKQLAQATQIPYQTIRAYRSHPERLDHASASTVHKIADFMLKNYYENQPFNVDELPLEPISNGCVTHECIQPNKRLKLRLSLPN